jgi:hypothetical protein
MICEDKMAYEWHENLTVFTTEDCSSTHKVDWIQRTNCFYSYFGAFNLLWLNSLCLDALSLK